MILRLSSSVARGAILLFAVFLFAFLSYFAIRNARAAHQAGLNTAAGFQRAVQLEPGNPENWYLLGRFWQYNLEDPDTQKAIQDYVISLGFDPCSGRTWAELGTAYELESDIPAAQNAFLRAKEVYPLSAEVAWRYGNFLLRQGRTEEAFKEIHRAVEAEPRRGAEAFSRCLRVEPNVDVIFDRVLPASSAVYADVLRDLATDNQIDNALKVWNRLVALHPHLALQDAYPLVSALLQRKDAAQALRVWDQAAGFAGLSQLRNPPDSAIWDGGFELGVSGSSFAWFFNSSSGDVQITSDSNEKHSGNRSLRLMFDGKTNINFADVCQYAVVHPSTHYRFSAWMRTAGITTEQGLRFRLGAIGTLDPSVVVTPELHGTQPWTRVEIPWDSTSDAQILQICLVRYPSGLPNGDIQGTAWVDDAVLLPESAESHQP